MGWVTEKLGAGAVVYPGSGVRDHARAAIQLLSGRIPKRKVFQHTGWSFLDGDAYYLHGAGAIGPFGQTRSFFNVRLPTDFQQYTLPDPPEGEELVEAIRASLGLLDLAPLPITVPLLAAVYGAPLRAADFALHLFGDTGVFKTELATLAQQHFGRFDSRSLPASWMSTGNAVEQLAFYAKDALLVVDDFAPTGSRADIERCHREADRLLRAQGNRAGRQRMSGRAGAVPGAVGGGGTSFSPSEARRVRSRMR